VGFTRDSKAVVSVVDSDIVNLLDASNGRALDALRVEGRRQQITSAAFSPGHNLLAVAGSNGVIRLWEAKGGKLNELPRVRRSSPEAVWGLAFSPDGDRLACGEGTHVVLRDLWGGTTRVLGSHSGLVTELAFSPDGTVLASGDSDGAVRLWDVVGGRPMGELSGHLGAAVFALAFHPDGSRIASADIRGSIQIHHIANGTLPSSAEMRRTDEGVIPIEEGDKATPAGKAKRAGSRAGRIAALRAGLVGEDHVADRETANELGRIAEKSTVTYLRGIVQRPGLSGDELRRAACWALGWTPVEVAVSSWTLASLRRARDEDPNAGIRRAAGWALRRLGAPAKSRRMEVQDFMKTRAARSPLTKAYSRRFAQEGAKYATVFPLPDILPAYIQGENLFHAARTGLPQPGGGVKLQPTLIRPDLEWEEIGLVLEDADLVEEAPNPFGLPLRKITVSQLRTLDPLELLQEILGNVPLEPGEVVIGRMVCREGEDAYLVLFSA
jgi:hypothetical protein